MVDLSYRIRNLCTLLTTEKLRGNAAQNCLVQQSNNTARARHLGWLLHKRAVAVSGCCHCHNYGCVAVAKDAGFFAPHTHRHLGLLSLLPFPSYTTGLVEIWRDHN